VFVLEEGECVFDFCVDEVCPLFCVADVVTGDAMACEPVADVAVEGAADQDAVDHGVMLAFLCKYDFL